MVIPSEKLLEIDPDRLFREHTVAELQNIQKSIQSEIEQKREELRSTVGERYRDLLKAADTITEMRNTAKSVVSCIKGVNTLCQSLQEKHLLGFSSNENAIETNCKYPPEEISRVIEIKLLLCISDQIWCAIEDKTFVYCGELCHFASFIFYDLQVSKIIDKYPIVSNVWNSIGVCRQAVLDAAHSELNTINLSPLESADCLTCLLLLEPKFLKLKENLVAYLQLRKEAFNHNLQSDDYATVKDKLRASVTLVQHTLLISCSCFIENGESGNLISKKCGSFQSSTAASTISKLPSVSPLADKYLPPTIKSFKPSTARPLTSFPPYEAKAILTNWLQEIHELLEKEMVNLLGLVGNLKSLVVVRDHVSRVNNPSDWGLVENVIGPSNIYESLAEPHIEKRALELVSGVLKDTFALVSASISDIDEELLKNSKTIVNQSEGNIRWFVWKETENDEVALQTRGFTPRVSQLCSVLDGQLKLLHDDIAAFHSKNPLPRPLFDFLNTCSFQTLERFSETLLENATKQNLSESSIILRARFLQALTTQCLNLKKCFQSFDNKESNGGKTWPEVSGILHSASAKMWRLWKEMTMPSFQSLIQEKLSPDISISALLSKPACELVTITEEAEDDQPVTSQLRVPSQPSFTLQELLLQVCLRLNSIAVHTLPRNVYLEIVESIANMILEHYDVISSNDTIYQSHASQLLFDVRFLTLLLLPRENQTLSQKLCKRLEETIDLFDLTVLYPYLQANVQKSAIRLQGTFGVLVDHNEKLAVLNSLKVAAGQPTASAPEEPNVLALASSVPWFPLLPISSGESKKKEESPSKQRKQRTKEGKKKESASADFVKTAGAIFNAIGWS